jgi:hypothetical protein
VIRLGCPLAETLGCRGKVRLVRTVRVRGRRATSQRLSRATFAVGGGRSKVVTVRRTRRARALLRARRAIRVRAVARAVDAAGNARETGRALVLRLPGRRARR